MYKVTGVPYGEGSAERSTSGCDWSEYSNTISIRTQRVTGAKCHARKFLPNYTKAKKAPQTQAASVWLNARQVCTLH